MDSPLRQPGEILAYRSLKAVLASKARVLWSVGPQDSVTRAVRLMADHDIGCVVVLETDRIAGIVSERDCARRVLLAGKSPEATAVAEIMVRNVVTVDLNQTFAECLNLMHRHQVRHLPVLDAGKPITVVSIRDLLSEAVSHHQKIIAELERERLTIFTSTA